MAGTLLAQCGSPPQASPLSLDQNVGPVRVRLPAQPGSQADPGTGRHEFRGTSSQCDPVGTAWCGQDPSGDRFGCEGGGSGIFRLVSHVGTVDDPSGKSLQ